MPLRHCHRPVAGLLSVALSLPSLPAWAGPADDLRDLVGARAAGAEADLERRGYTHIDTHKDREAAYGYWWSNDRRSCVRVTTRDGRYAALADVDASDCGQTRKASGVSDGAKVAMGAAALLGVAALLHKSHHRDDRDFDERQTAEFERGYRDGLYNNSFNASGSDREYRDGYNKGVAERSSQSGYRWGSSNNGGYRSGWTTCAREGEYCRVDGAARVRYGADNRYVYRNVNGSVLCSERVFGDPAYGVHKTCEFEASGSGYGGGYGGGNRGSWEYCGSEDGYCSFSGPGEVRYGVNGRYVVRRAINGLPCNVKTFGSDPAVGQHKQCHVRQAAR